MDNIPVYYDEFRDFIEGWIVGLFGNGPWVTPVADTIVWIVVIIVVFTVLTPFFVGIYKISKCLKEKFVLSRYNKEEQRRRSRRQMFADFMEAEIRRLNTQEAWSDHRFAELEAEVEAEGKRTRFSFFRKNNYGGAILRKEKSLSKALENSSERLILVEGEPGSGKSVALRHLTQIMSRRASDSKYLNSVIPLYVNLKHLRRAENQEINRNLIDEFIHKSLNRINDRDIEDFLDDEFQKGIEEGTWLFLFDSFDEIPDVLSSTEADITIRKYAEAISDFLQGMNKCRGIVASREYKGPRFLGWPKFRILPLSLDRKLQLIKRTGMKTNLQNMIIEGISRTATDFKSFTSNPMFLNLLCEYIIRQDMPEFPQHTHNVFKDYIWKRLTRDEERLRERFSKTPAEIREAAEKLAYCMTADTGIGLSPTLDQLLESTKRQALYFYDFDTIINALEYSKIARIEVSLLDGQRYFTFAHRRFQEYFATAIVLREPDRINLSSLLNDARWRETAVVMLQTQSIETISPILSEAMSRLSEIMRELENKYPEHKKPQEKLELPKYSLGKLARRLFEKKSISREKIGELFDKVEILDSYYDQMETLGAPLDWPKNLYHMLGILQDSLSARKNLLPTNLQKVIDDILLFILNNGSLDDQKWAIDIAGCASTNVLERAVDVGFSSPGNWIRNAAFLQVARLGEIPARFSRYIISNLMARSYNEFLIKKRSEIYAQYSRFADRNYLYAAKLIIWMPFLDLGLILITIIMLLSIQSGVDIIILLLIFLFLIFGWLARWRPNNSLFRTFEELGADLFESIDRVLNPLFSKIRKNKKRYKSFPFSQLAYMYASLIFPLVALMFMTFPFWSSRLSSNMNDIFHQSHPLVSLLLYVCLQSWIFIAVIEAGYLKRTSLAWLVLFFFYPVIIFALVPFLVITLVGDYIYMFSRLGVAIDEFKKRGDRKIIRVMMSKYQDLSLPFYAIVMFIVIRGLLLLINNFGFIVVFLGVVVALVEVFFVMKVIINFLTVTIKEEKMYRAISGQLNQVNFIEFVKIISSLTNNKFRTRIIQTIIEKRSFEATNENYLQLRSLIAFVQANIKNSYTLDQYATKVATFDTALAAAISSSDNNKSKREYYWTAEQLDLLCKLLEQLQQSLKVNS
jgi:hypothetical protein